MGKKYVPLQYLFSLASAFLVAMFCASHAMSFTAENGIASSRSTASGLVVNGAPTITGFSPGSGQVGTTVTVTGTNLSGATSVLFGGLPATGFTVNPGGTQLTVTVPRMASSQHLRVTTPAGTALSPDAFHVTRVSSSSIAVNVYIPILTSNGNTTILTPGTFTKPTATDLDGDGLIDLLVGDGATGRITHFEQSSANSTNFNGGAEITSNGSTPIDVGTDAVPIVTDLDGNGLLDLLVGNVAGTVQRYEQTTPNGTVFSGGATLTTDGVTSLSVILRSAPTVTDLDGDGLLDLLVGRAQGPTDGTGPLNGQVLHFEQTTPNGLIFAPVGNLTTDGTTPLDAGANAIPVVTDIDGDGLLDLLVGNLVGTVLRYEQTTPNGTVFGGGSPLTHYYDAIFDTDRLSAPTVTDIDSDGLLDILVGNANGAIVRVEQPIISGFALAGGSTTVCVGSVVTFTAAVGLGKSYTLISNAGHNLTGTVSSPGFSQTLVFNLPQQFVYLQLLVLENGIYYSEVQSLQVGPELKLTTEPMSPPMGLTVGIGQSISLTASLTEQSAQNTFLWSNGSPTSSIVDNPVSTTAYSVTATDSRGCTAVTGVAATVMTIACGPVIYVTESGSGLQDGSSWANALPGRLLQTAINWAGFCGSSQVWVAAGLYTPISVSVATTADRAVSFSMRNNVAIYGGFVGTETLLSERPAINPIMGSGGASKPSTTTLSGDIGTVGSVSDNSNNVVHNSSGLTNSAVIDGFVFKHAGGYNDNYLTSGGGIFNNDGSYGFCDPIIRNCLFDGQGGNTEALINDAWYGGRTRPLISNCSFVNCRNTAIQNDGLAGESSPTFTSCFFGNNQDGAVYNWPNTSSESGVEVGGITNSVFTSCTFTNNSNYNGGAIYTDASRELDRATLVLTDCFFIGNRATREGGALNNHGVRGMVSLTAINTTFASNTADRGGAVYNEGSNDGRFMGEYVRCRFINNVAEDQSGAMEINGIYGGNCQTKIVNSSFVGNQANEYMGGAIGSQGYDGLCSLTVINTSFVGNRLNDPYGSGVALANWESAFYIVNSIFYDNEGARAIEFPSSRGTMFMDYSAAEASVTNFTALTPGSNLTLAASPFVSATDLTLVGCSPLINAGDPSTTSTLVGATDLAGNSRFMRAGTPVDRIDMGAYEFQGVNMPASYSVLGSGTATCASSPTITLSGSETGVSYQLQRDGLNSGTAVAGTGSVISFGPQSLSGVYSVLATPVPAGCTALMATSATVVSSTAVISASLVASGAISCSSTSVTLTASPINLMYAFGGGATQIGTTNQATVVSAGTYSVTVTDAGGCSAVASAMVSGTVLTSVAITADGPIGCGRTTATVMVQGSGASSYTLLGPASYSQVNNTGVFVVTAGGSYTGMASQSGCVLSGTLTVSEGGIQPTAMNFRASGVLGSGSCSVQLLATATGDRYTVTGAGGYVFSNVYRTVGTRELLGFTVTQPGTYTLTVYSGSCSASYTTVVSGTACP